jgi:Rrf2 family protein
MHVTARVGYALQAMVALAEAGGERLAVAAIAEQLDLSYHYLLSIVGELRRAGLVHLVRGPSGGLALARPAVDITLGEIILAIDGPLTLADGSEPNSLGINDSGGYLPSLWVAAHRAMLDVFSQVQLADARPPSRAER